MKLLFLMLAISTNVTNCVQKKEDNKKLLLAGGLLYLSSPVADYNCNTSPSPVSFEDFKISIDTLNTSVYKCSDCHGVNTAQANFIITNYKSVLERVNPNSPNTSVLYFKVKPGGAMNVYSNAQVNQAIYCWILNGANP